MKLNAKVIGIAAVALLLAGGIGFTIGNPEAVAGLSGSLTGAVDYSSGTQYMGLKVAIGGVDVPRVESVRGCNWLYPSADATTSTDGTKTYSTTRSQVRPCVVTLQGPVPAPLQQWATDTLMAKNPYRDVSVVLVTTSGTPGESFLAGRALLTGLEVAPLDASSSAPLRVTATFQPESLARGTGAAGTTAKSSTLAYANAFKVSLNGAALDTVSVRAFNFTAPPRDVTTGIDARYVVWGPGPVTVGPLVLTTTDAAQSTLYAWENAVAKGTLDRRTVTVELLDGARVPMQRFDLHDASFVELAPRFPEPGASGRLTHQLTVQPARLSLT